MAGKITLPFLRNQDWKKVKIDTEKVNKLLPNIPKSRKDSKKEQEEHIDQYIHKDTKMNGKMQSWRGLTTKMAYDMGWLY